MASDEGSSETCFFPCFFMFFLCFFLFFLCLFHDVFMFFSCFSVFFGIFRCFFMFFHDFSLRNLFPIKKSLFFSHILSYSFQINNSCTLAIGMLGSDTSRKVVLWSLFSETPFDHYLKTSWGFDFGQLSSHSNQAPLHLCEVNILDDSGSIFN